MMYGFFDKTKKAKCEDTRSERVMSENSENTETMPVFPIKPISFIIWSLVKVILYLLVPVVAATAGERVQSPDAQWKTIKTQHYHINYPANPKGDFESFAVEVASKIDGIHAVVAEMVGFEAKGPIQVTIRDPYMESNASVLPSLTRPLVELWKTLPESYSEIGHYDNYVEMVLTHEITHLHHLLRPSKSSVMPIGPIKLKAPRMIEEGYATLLEGRVTGTGRPHSAYRAAVIRQWALQGKLPDYSAVSKVNGFRGGSMAYLIGSSYLEWLEQQNPGKPDILQRFWAQLTSKGRYDDSFKAIFGMKPEDSYDRWRVEVTYDAVTLEQNAKANDLVREGWLVARFNSEITHLSVSPDGTKLMARMTGVKEAGVWIWDLEASQELLKDLVAKQISTITSDLQTADESELIVKVRAKPLFKRLTVIGRYNGALPRNAWWTGNDQVTFEVRLPNGEGVVEPVFMVIDLKTGKLKSTDAPVIDENSEFTWSDVDGAWNIVRKLPDGREQQLTRTLSAAWNPAPTPDGKTLYYVRLTATGCEIRWLDLEQPPLESVSLFDLENPLVRNAVVKPQNSQSLLPPPVETDFEVVDYSVWNTHRIGVPLGISFSPSTAAVQIGLGGSDLLERLDWSAVYSFGKARGPSGAAVNVEYNGWRFAPSMHAFYSLEKPSAQQYEPVSGFDRTRRGAEIAFSWRRLGTSPLSIRPFAAFESVKYADNTDSIPAATRFLGGISASAAVSRSRGGWGFGVAVESHNAFGHTGSGDDVVDDGGWKIARLRAGLTLKTPAGPLKLSAEEGRVRGNHRDMDLFHLGGQNTGLVSDTLDMNRVQQPALPDYLQVGDRMRRWRVEYGSEVYLYFESSLLWYSGRNVNDSIRVVGAEVRVEKIANTAVFRVLGLPSTMTMGIHCPLDGVMKDRMIFTINFKAVR